MRKYKTNPKYRKSYRYYFVDGSFREMKANDDVTSEMIAFLHQLDDEEVDRERRNQYRTPIHYEDFLKKWNPQDNPLLIDRRTPWERLVCAEERRNQYKVIQQLHLGIQTLTPKQRKTIHQIFYEGKTQVEVAREEGVGKMAIHDRIRGALKKLKIFLEK